MANYFDQPFPVQVLSGAPLKSGFGSSGLVYSWSEVVIDAKVGFYSGMPSPRLGMNNAREINAANLSGHYPFYSTLDYEGSVSGQPFYSFNAAGVPGAAGPPGPATSIFLYNTAANSGGFPLSGSSTVIDNACAALYSDSGGVVKFNLIDAVGDQDQFVIQQATNLLDGTWSTNNGTRGAGVGYFNAGWQRLLGFKAIVGPVDFYMPSNAGSGLLGSGHIPDGSPTVIGINPGTPANSGTLDGYPSLFATAFGNGVGLITFFPAGFLSGGFASHTSISQFQLACFDSAVAAAGGYFTYSTNSGAWISGATSDVAVAGTLSGTTKTLHYVNGLFVGAT